MPKSKVKSDSPKETEDMTDMSLSWPLNKQGIVQYDQEFLYVVYTRKNLTTCQQDMFVTGLYSKFVNKL